MSLFLCPTHEIALFAGFFSVVPPLTGDQWLLYDAADAQPEREIGTSQNVNLRREYLQEQSIEDTRCRGPKIRFQLELESQLPQKTYHQSFHVSKDHGDGEQK